MKRSLWQCCLLLGWAGLASSAAIVPASPLSPAEELASFELADPELMVELVAAEPAVSSPVALTWDAAGRLFVAEMRDYPKGTNGGSIRRLEDRDGDGRFESSTVFADGLQFPNSVLPWRGGLLVTAAPDLWFLRDNDGDGRAEERRVLFTGFGTGNQQLRANGLAWGLDGWVYGANGRSDGTVHRPGETKGVSLRGRDFRFQPGTGAWETLAGRSQFGLGLDEWGNRFLSWNTIPIRHEVLPDRYLARNPQLPFTEVLVDLLPANDTGRVFPLTAPPRVFNNESSSHFNALAGLYLYRGAELGVAYRGNAFVGESLRNVVHRRVLEPAGVTFVARRLETETEFLRSRDPWFHPVNFATGPDGWLYIADFHREYVEHPDFVPSEMRTRVEWRTGHEQGRIWRVRRRDHRISRAPVQFAGRSPADWVRQLGHAGSWQRETAQRLLLEREERPDPAILRRLAKQVEGSRQPETRLRALYTLAALSRLTEPVLVRALRDAHAGVRAGAAELAGGILSQAGPHHVLLTEIQRGTRDKAPRVQLESALALGGIRDEGPRESALAAVLAENTNRWVRLAALSGSSRPVPPTLRAELWPPPAAPLRPAPRPSTPAPDRERVVAQYQSALALTGDRVQGAAIFAQLCLACHSLQGQGQRVGPDLAGIGARPADALLSDILDPSRQVAPDYAAYEFALKDGEAVVGLFASETPTRITVRRPGAPDENLARTALRSVTPTGKSLMPDGLEAEITVQGMSDLIAFLRQSAEVELPR